jgi:hypothetical protein
VAQIGQGGPHFGEETLSCYVMGDELGRTGLPAWSFSSLFSAIATAFVVDAKRTLLGRLRPD